MISLRSLVSLTTVVATALTLAACSDNSTNPLSTGLQAGSANFKSSKNTPPTAPVDARVLLDNAGNAVLEMHTGTFNDGTNTGTPQGMFSSITYTVKDAASNNKTITTHTVSFNKTTSSYFVHLTLCQSSNDDDDDDDGSSRASSCTSHWGSQYVLTFTANLKNIGSDGKTAGTGSGTATVLNAPDLDLSQQQLFIVGAGGTQTPATSVNPSTPTTFSVPFPNNKPIGGVANTVGLQSVVCVVTVDGHPQLPIPNGVYNQYLNPNAFGYVGSSAIQNINAGSTGSCDFTLSLPAGTHKIVVAAASLYPCDYDLSNNSTQTFTVNSAVSGPADVAAGLMTADAGGTAGNVTLDHAVITAGQAGVKLYVGASLVSGAAPTGAVPCTITITSTVAGSTPTVLSGSVTLTAASPIASCLVTTPYVFAAAGTYTAVGSVNAAGDPNAANNTTAPVTVTVSAPAPSANVSVGMLSFTDAAEGITGQQFAPSIHPAADTVHSGDVATYSASINVTALQNATSVPTITCSATVDGVAVTGSAWITQTISNATATSAPTCGFTKAIVDLSNTLKPHTIVFSISTGSFTNYAATTATSLTGTINAVQRIDITAGGLQLLVGGVWKPIGASDAGVKQGTTDTVRTIITSHSPIATIVNCGTLGPATSSDADAAAQLGPIGIGTTTNVAVAANSSNAICQYQIKAPQQLALIAINMVAPVTPASGQPLDQNPADNVATGVVTVVTGGSFTDIKKGTFNAVQKWTNTANTDVGVAMVGGASLTSQYLDVNQLALLVVPTQAVLGVFTLTGSVQADSSGLTTSFGTGVVTGSLVSADALHTNPCITAGPLASLGNPWEPQLVYQAQVCAEASTDFPGYQRITVSYTPSLNGTVDGSQIKYVFHSPIVVKIALDFTLNGSQVQNHVTATITIPVGNPTYGCTGNIDATAFACSTVFNTSANAVTVTTP